MAVTPTLVFYFIFFGYRIVAFGSFSVLSVRLLLTFINWPYIADCQAFDDRSQLFYVLLVEKVTESFGWLSIVV